MADENITDDSASTSSSVSLASCKKKPRPRGPYNQYLSQPGAKIPRTTLKVWPDQNFATTSISPMDNSVDDLITSRSNDTCSGSSIITDYMEMHAFEVPHSLLHQTGVSSERAWFERPLNEYEAHDDDNEQSYDTLLEGEVQETPKPTESEQATIAAAEDEQDGVEEYLDAFNSDESAGDVNTDQEEKTFADVPLYNGAPISVAVSMLLIVTFAIRHSLTGLAIVDLLTLVSLHCALPNQCASSMILLKKFFTKLKNPIQFHYYCTFCMEYQGLSIPEERLCKNRSCLKDLSKKENSSYFIIIPLMCQLRDLIQS